MTREDVVKKRYLKTELEAEVAMLSGREVTYTDAKRVAEFERQKGSKAGAATEEMTYVDWSIQTAEHVETITTINRARYSLFSPSLVASLGPFALVS